MTRSGSPKPQRSDAGAVLALTLVMIVVFALVAVAITSYVATALRTTRVSEGRVDRLAAAESGMQEVLVQLDASGTCPAALAGRNGATLTVDSCEVEAVPLSDGTAPFGLILTALGLNSGTDAFVRNGSSVNTVNVGGKVFVALIATGDAQNVVATGHVISQATDCPDTGRLTGPAWLGVADSECTEQKWQAYTQTPQIPAVTSANVLQPTGCQRLEPGPITSETIVRGDAYFASGVYRVQAEVLLQNDPPGDGRITAGHNGTVTLPSDHACHAAQVADVGDGGAEGVVFVLEGAGRITFDSNHTTAEFYGLDTGTRRLSLVAYGSSGSGFEAPGGAYGASMRNPQNEPILEKTNGTSNSSFSFFGEVWTPRGFFDLEQMSSSGAAGAAFQGGAVISRFRADTSQDVSGLLFTGGETLTQTYVRARVTAATPDGTSTTVSAVTLRPPESPLRILSWRVL